MTELTGKCHCGAIRYTITANPINHVLCHCSDCRRHSGTHMVGWAMLPLANLDVQGTPKVYASSEHGRRHFCSACGTGLFYSNAEFLPDLIDVQTGTLDDPAALPAQSHIQVKERVDWTRSIHELPEFEGFSEQAE